VLSSTRHWHAKIMPLKPDSQSTPHAGLLSLTRDSDSWRPEEGRGGAVHRCDAGLQFPARANVSSRLAIQYPRLGFWRL